MSVNDKDICVDLTSGSIGGEIKRRFGGHVGLILHLILDKEGGVNSRVGESGGEICFEDKNDVRKTVKFLEENKEDDSFNFVIDRLYKEL